MSGQSRAYLVSFSIALTSRSAVSARTSALRSSSLSQGDDNQSLHASSYTAQRPEKPLTWSLSAVAVGGAWIDLAAERLVRADATVQSFGGAEAKRARANISKQLRPLPKPDELHRSLRPAVVTISVVRAR